MIALPFIALTAALAKTGWGQGLGTPDSGQLCIQNRDGVVTQFCPLEHTSVRADVAGFGARVHVVQTFTNPSTTPVEAIYTFPLPEDAAVDQMRFKVGDRVIEGVIKRREEAQRIYEAAKNAGRSAALLDQERPNIFTQSIANIMPGQSVKVDISYAQVLKYEAGEFEFVYPMVVGPRFLGNTPDPGKVAPPIAPQGTRSGSTIDLSVNIDAGAPIQDVESTLHRIVVIHQGDTAASVSLQNKGEIPNRDFILHYTTATNSVQSAFVTNYDGLKGGFFDLMLLPPKSNIEAYAAPREMIFVVDQSGSQQGFPIEKSKELTLKLLKTMRPGDTFNVFSFNTVVHQLWPSCKRYSPETLAEAHTFLDGIRASDGTYLENALHDVMQIPTDPNRLRVIVLNTDGYVGDEPQVLTEIKRDRQNARIFTFGIGNSVNRYLINAMSAEGRGASEMVTLASSSEAAVDRFAQRLNAPILTDLSVKADGIELTEMMPRDLPDVFSDRPIVIQGRYPNPGHGKLILSGRLAGRPWTQTLNLNFADRTGDPCVATLWARKRVDDLEDRSFEQQFIPEGSIPTNYQAKIIDTALQYGVVSQYTSFVAVEPRRVNIGGRLITVHVPVDMADGVSYNGIYGPTPTSGLTGTTTLAAGGSGIGGGGGGGFGGGGGSAGSGAFGGRSFPPGSFTGANQSNSKVTRRIVNRGSGMPERTFEGVVDGRVRSASGRIAVMIFLQNTDPATIEKLRKLGVTIDETDHKLNLVFGMLDTSKLKELFAIIEIDRIEPAE